MIIPTDEEYDINEKDKTISLLLDPTYESFPDTKTVLEARKDYKEGLAKITSFIVNKNIA